MTERVIMAGFGGQGMMLIGKVFAAVAMEQGLHVTFFPSYGAEVRGGTAHCQIVVSDEEIYSPIVETADTLILMNQASCDKFLRRLSGGGLLLHNGAMAGVEGAPGDSRMRVRVEATEEANALGNVRAANVVMLGAYAALRPTLPPDALLAGVLKRLPQNESVRAVNRKAFQRGMDLAAAFRAP